MSGTTAAIFLQDAAQSVDQILDRVLPPEDEAPQRLHAAMRYAVFSGGKRLRPALVLAAAKACGGADDCCAAAMAAVELLHCYTLVHDDLPAMDDDDLRRGRPTVHKAFDEATAILVGDALGTLATEVLCGAGLEAVRCLSQAAGSRGVVGGQQDDLDATQSETDADSAARLRRIHERKTAALIRASCELGAICADAGPDKREAMRRFGEDVGLAFQVVDDLLDCTVDASVLGKTPGKDAAQGKLTYVSLHGIERAREQAAELRQAADDCLSPFGPEANHLRALAHFILDRNH